MRMRAVSIGLVVGGLLLASSAAQAQVNQIHPRVMIMLDTSGSMVDHINNNTSSGADGSTSYTDLVMSRSQSVDGSDGMYPGYETGTATCPAAGNAGYDGVNSRMYNGKVAITNVVNGSGDIDWGLMRYTGFDCPLVETFTPFTCSSNNQCGNNSCAG